MRKNVPVSKKVARILITIVIILVTLVMIVPFVWMISASFKTEADVMKIPIEWIPKYFYPDNYKRVLSIGTTSSTNYHFGLAYFNSIKVASNQYGSGNYFRNTCRICICKVEIQGLQCIVHYISGADDGAFTADTDSQIHNVYAVGMDEYPFVIDRTEDHSGIFHLYAQAVLLKYSG